MPVTLEEDFVLLYTLYACGGKPSKARATHFIMSNKLMKERDGDTDVVATRESRIENRIAWSRQNLKNKGYLSMPDHGIWGITKKGILRVENLAVKSLTWDDQDGIPWGRFSDEFVRRLKILGLNLKKQKEKTVDSQDVSLDATPTSSGAAEGRPQVI